MPGGDRTGPAGMGPLTGRAAGYCAGHGVPGFMNPYGRRMGGGFGWGRGRGPFWGYPPGVAFWGAPYGVYPYAPPYSGEQEKQALQSQVKFFVDRIAALRKRIEELESEAREDKG